MKIPITVKPNTCLNNKTGSWRVFKPTVDYAKCISCGICKLVCPEGCVNMATKDGHQKLMPKIDYDYCKGCGVCAEECPVKAILMERQK
jgi:2-oxoacid:acceptor oxidoreductase delta subunit (pyruvate/2-ketoisovalerate family)